MEIVNPVEKEGFAAMALGLVSYFPVVLNVHKTKRTNNFPYYSILGLLCAQICWFIYGLYSKTSATEYSGFILSVMYLYILYVKLNYKS